MTETDGAAEIDPTSSIAEAFGNEYSRIIQRKNGLPRLQAFGLEVYKVACSDLLPVQEILPRALRDACEKFFRDQDSKQMAAAFPSGMRICLAVIPFTTSGIPLEQEEMKGHGYFRILGLRDDGLTYGFSSEPGYYFPLLPAEIQNDCSFQVPYYQHGTPSTEDLALLKERFMKCFDALKKLIERN